VINHLGKPSYDNKGALYAWKMLLGTLTEYDCYVKLSGVVTEVSVEHNESVDVLIGKTLPWLRTLFETVGLDRVLWGSDWPVLRVGFKTEQQKHKCLKFWFQFCEKVLDELAVLPEERETIYYANTVAAYNLAR
jgi:predicted TIM-barrel fold metal-dependent hydrolase